MVNTTDRRVVRTKKNIKRAFSELLKEKGFEAITVQDIADRADINRGTFYLHFLDKYDLFERRVDDILAELIASVPLDYAMSQTANACMEPRIVQSFAHFQKYRDFYKLMFEDGTNTYFHTRFIELLKNHFEQSIEDMKRSSNATIPINKDLIIHYGLFSFMGILKYWLDQDPPLSPEDMAKQLISIYEFEAARSIEEKRKY
ncbi:TetR/AcrR family transcriptional regulator [Paenibacillus arenosi]|uniref:TetR/AcrR family transcriptional regulator n=1 Tax=Paenibacillus arenosi TaxID=2774142 RepID=A0ABR9B050_9BACL|nr:TetR/AcrR family transcriptional regulator [Paenibacillus arenosi]MBD8499779.1 TetR/AcrR family transcriptional regulator [Paenibacillus arenosi]